MVKKRPREKVRISLQRTSFGNVSRSSFFGVGKWVTLNVCSFTRFSFRSFFLSFFFYASVFFSFGLGHLEIIPKTNEANRENIYSLKRKRRKKEGNKIRMGGTPKGEKTTLILENFRVGFTGLFLMIHNNQETNRNKTKAMAGKGYTIRT